MTITNEKLLSYHRDIENMQGTIFEVFDRSKINEFYKQCKTRLETLSSELKALQDEYSVIENNQIKTVLKKVKQPQLPKTFWQKIGFKKSVKIMDKEEQEPVMKNGMLREDYEKKYFELMDKTININL